MGLRIRLYRVVLNCSNNYFATLPGQGAVRRRQAFQVHLRKDWNRMAANARSAAKSIIVLNRFKIYVTTLPRESSDFTDTRIYWCRLLHCHNLPICKSGRAYFSTWITDLRLGHCRWCRLLQLRSGSDTTKSGRKCY